MDNDLHQTLLILNHCIKLSDPNISYDEDKSNVMISKLILGDLQYDYSALSKDSIHYNFIEYSADLISYIKDRRFEFFVSNHDLLFDETEREFYKLFLKYLEDNYLDAVLY